MARNRLIPDKSLTGLKRQDKNKSMDRDQATATLRAYEPELKAIGVLSASVFGSVARGDAGPDSDVDVVVKLGKSFSVGGFDYFGQLEDLHRRLSAILGCKVDVIEEPVRKARLQAEIDRDRAFAF
jgi:predicted nucleotidyltransferase